MSLAAEVAEKQRRLTEFMDAAGYDAVLLARTDNFAWFTAGGDSFVSLAQEAGVGALLVQRDRRILITNNVERPRLLEEELSGQAFGEDISPWADDALPPAIARLVAGQKIAADVSLPGVTECASDIAALRASLTPDEVARYRALGADVGAAIAEACMDLEPGMSEHEAAAALAGAHFRRGIQPVVVLVAADERLKKYRHPIPTDSEIRRVVMLVVCGRQHGLIVSATPRAMTTSGSYTTRAAPLGTPRATTAPPPKWTTPSSPTRPSPGTPPSQAPSPRTPSSPRPTAPRSSLPRRDSPPSR